MQNASPRYQLIQVRLGRDLRQYVTERWTALDSWRTIAADLRSITGVDVSHETLRTWFEDLKASRRVA